MDDRQRMIESWGATERDLRAALAPVADQLPEASKWVTEYLDHSELGLACETLVYELDRLGIRAPEETVSSLRSAVARMGDRELEPTYRDAWERLQRVAEG